MGAPFFGEAGSPAPKKRLYQRIHNRLSTTPACSDTRYTPSRIRPRKVITDVDPTMFVSNSDPVSTARLEIEFLLQPEWDHYWFQWIEPARNLSCGWHQDPTHMHLGKCHFQIDFPDGSHSRTPASYHHHHPLHVLDIRLTELPEKLQIIDSEI